MLTADRVDVARGRIAVDRQVIESRPGPKLGLPQSRRQRTTMFPRPHTAGRRSRGPGRATVGRAARRRAAVPRSPGGRARWSNTRRNVFDSPPVARRLARDDDGDSVWTFHSPFGTHSRRGRCRSPALASRTSPTSWATPLCASAKTSSDPTPTSTTASTSHRLRPSHHRANQRARMRGPSRSDRATGVDSHRECDLTSHPS